jgi:hypothetical protein
MGLDMSVYKKNRKNNETEEILYWRKANQIHGWFVDMFMDGQDNCQIVYISWGALQDLKDICKQVLEDRSRAEELLPTREGFFFGSTEYNEYYFEDLAETVAKIEAISLDDISDCDLFYNASW